MCLYRIDPNEASETANFLIAQDFPSKGVKTHTMRGQVMFSKMNSAKKTFLIGPQDACFQFADYFGYPYVCQLVTVHVTGDRVTRRHAYTAFPSVESVYQWNKTRKAKFKSVFEVIRADRPCRVYFDIDCKLSGCDAAPTAHQLKDLGIRCAMRAEDIAVASGVPKHFAQFVNVKDRHGWRTDPSGGVYKISFHVILPYVIMSSNHSGAMAVWAESVNVLLRIDFEDILGFDVCCDVVDPRVYTKNRLMSLVGCCKPPTGIEDVALCKKMNMDPVSSSHEDAPLDQFEMCWLSISPKMDTSCLYDVSCAPAMPIFGDTQYIGDSEYGGDDDEDDADIPDVVTSANSLPDNAGVALFESEKSMLADWARKFFDMRVTSLGFPRVPFNSGSWKVRGEVVYMTAPCDRYCEIAKREHKGDRAGTQTSYEFNLLTSDARQRCFSCPVQGVHTKMSVYGTGFDMFNVLCHEDDDNISNVLADEFRASELVHVVPISRSRYVVWVWDQKNPAMSGQYDAFCGDSHLWVSGDIGFFKKAIVLPWLKRKFAMLMRKFEGDEKKLKLITKEKKKKMVTARATTIANLAMLAMCERSNRERFVDSLNTSESFMIPTNSRTVIDLENMVTIPRTPEMRFSLESDFSLLDLSVPECAARVNRFNSFVLQVMQGNKEKTEYLQTILGYSLTGDHADRRLYTHLGVGSNGKSSIDDCIKAALGSYHSIVRPGFVSKKMGQNSSSCSPDVIAVVHARFIACNETAHGVMMDDSRIKIMADGGGHSARALYEDERQIHLPGKLHIYTNFMLRFSPQDLAIVDRLSIIRYPMRFVNHPNPAKSHEAQKDPALVDALKKDTDAVGTWLCIGARRAIKQIKKYGRITMPESVQTETKEEIKKIDIMSEFFETHVEFHPAVSGVKSMPACVSRDEWSYDKQDLFSAFKAFLNSSGSEDKFDAGAFNGCSERFFANTNKFIVSYNHGTSYYWHGVRSVMDDQSCPAQKKRRISSGVARPVSISDMWVNTD